MLKPLTLLCITAFVLLGPNARAQMPDNFMRLFGGMIQQGLIQAAQTEWRKLAPNEVSCVDQALRQQGASVDALANRGVFPSDLRLAQLRSNCRGEIAQAPPPSPGQPSPYIVDGLALGGHVKFDSTAYKQYNCGPSEKFPGFTWCHKEKTERTNRGEITLSNSILHTDDGTAWYVNRYIEPAFFTQGELRNEIERLAARFGEQPREFWLPHREGLPDAVIVVWGKIELRQLNAADVATVASGATVYGLLVSYLGDLQRSARAGVPVCRLGGGPGFVWAATFNQNGRGVLRFLASDMSKTSSSVIGTDQGDTIAAAGAADKAAADKAAADKVAADKAAADKAAADKAAADKAAADKVAADKAAADKAAADQAAADKAAADQAAADQAAADKAVADKTAADKAAADKVAADRAFVMRAAGTIGLVGLIGVVLFVLLVKSKQNKQFTSDLTTSRRS